MSMPQIFTIGHSTRTIEEFIALLKEHNIRLLADVRLLPGSTRHPHFNAETLAISLQSAGIDYTHIKSLGGRRKPRKDSVNTAWRVEAFRGYADYMETAAFQEAAESLQLAARTASTAIMCSEAVWWSCHRSLISDYLKWKGWEVIHIMGPGKTTVHPYTQPAKIVKGMLSYREEDLFT